MYVCGSISGTYAEYALCNSHNVYALPSNLSFSQGAAIYVPYYTAYRALIQRYDSHRSLCEIKHCSSHKSGELTNLLRGFSQTEVQFSSLV